MKILKITSLFILVLGLNGPADAGTVSKLAPIGLGGTDKCEQNWSKGCNGCYTGRLTDGGANSSQCDKAPKCNQACKDQPLE
jgi:hypothetical protein